MGSGKTIRLTSAQALLRYLSVQRTETDGESEPLFAGVWGIFGHGNVAGIGQALEQNQYLPYFQARNEQGMVHAATAFAKQRNRKQLFACTSSVGPGATNMITGAATATINRIPVLLLPGDTFAARTPGPVLQQLEQFHAPEVSVNDCFRPVSVYWDRICRPEQLLHSLPAAIKTLVSPSRTGACTLALPQDTQAEAWDYPASFFETVIHRIARPRADRRAEQKAWSLLKHARRPFIIAGGGVRYSGASAELAEFSEATGIPVGETQAGKGVLSWKHPSAVGATGATGTLAANRLATNADLIFFIGCRMSDFTTASGTQFQCPDVTFVGLNVHENDTEKYSALSLHGDARETLREYLNLLKTDSWSVPGEYKKETASLRNAWQEERSELVRARTEAKFLSQARILELINNDLTERDTVVGAAGGLPGDMHKLLNLQNSSQYNMEYGFSCMGYEIAGGLGVKMAKKDGEVFVLSGDGSYLMLHSELLTSLQEDQKIIVVLSDNHGFRCIHKLAESCGSLGFGNEFRKRNPADGLLTGDYLPVDFIRYAEALGARAIKAHSESDLENALKQARGSLHSCVIVVETDQDHSLPSYSTRWNVPVAEVSEKEPVQQARLNWEQNFSEQGKQ